MRINEEKILKKARKLGISTDTEIKQEHVDAWSGGNALIREIERFKDLYGLDDCDIDLDAGYNNVSVSFIGLVSRPLDEIIKDIQEKEDIIKALKEQDRAAEYAEYLRLKEKFGGEPDVE